MAAAADRKVQPPEDPTRVDKCVRVPAERVRGGPDRTADPGSKPRGPARAIRRVWRAPPHPLAAGSASWSAPRALRRSSVELRRSLDAPPPTASLRPPPYVPLTHARDRGLSFVHVLAASRDEPASIHYDHTCAIAAKLECAASRSSACGERGKGKGDRMASGERGRRRGSVTAWRRGRHVLVSPSSRSNLGLLEQVKHVGGRTDRNDDGSEEREVAAKFRTHDRGVRLAKNELHLRRTLDWACQT